MHYFKKYFYFARYTKCQGFIYAQKYSCQICIILATGCQIFGRLNRRLSEVLYSTSISSADPKLFHLYGLRVTGTTPYAVKTTAGPCYDRISNCDAYDKLACVEPYLSWAKQNCERTCNLCSKKIFYIQIRGILKFITFG